MDRNSIIGLLLIGVLIIGYSIYTQPSEEERKLMLHQRDSIALVRAAEQKMEAERKAVADTTIAASPVLNDSAKEQIAMQQLGDFASAANGTETFYTLENSLIKVKISSKGGRVHGVELKNYKTSDGGPVVLMGSDSSVFNLSFPAQNRSINTSELFFKSPGVVNNRSAQSVSLRLNAGNDKYVEYLYSLDNESYMMNFKINMSGLNDVISPNATYLALDWKDYIIKKEGSLTNERSVTTVYYRFADEEVDYITPTSDEQQSLKTKVKWIAFKQQFFTSVLIADLAFDSPIVETKTDETSKHVKTLSASFSLPFEHSPMQTYGMKFYFGPNHYQTLKKIDDLNLEKQIHLGWGIFGWVNRFIVIPIFNFLNGFNLNFGIIILILTVIVRIIILPLTFGSFKSQAKMKVLAPEIAEISAKYPDTADAMKKQQATMALYKQAGVNPMGGCIPGLLQMPILIAMFSFFPVSIELRQQSFLWAHDLSTYDSILDLGFNIPFYGDHVSLFTLLMTVSTLLFTKLNMQMTAATNNPMMKWMMYIMPVMFLGIFNNYSAGLSYYYFLSNMFGLGQQYLFKYFIDEDAIHRKIQENRKRPAKKPSSFQQRLEKMAKERGYPVKK
jgi:YidC/Oxa1 family membrane protein insertase